MVVALAGRCGQVLVGGDGNLSPASMGDMRLANSIAREMVLRCGFKCAGTRGGLEGGELLHARASAPTAARTQLYHHPPPPLLCFSASGWAPLP